MCQSQTRAGCGDRAAPRTPHPLTLGQPQTPVAPLPDFCGHSQLDAMWCIAPVLPLLHTTAEHAMRGTITSGCLDAILRVVQPRTALVFLAAAAQRKLIFNEAAFRFCYSYLGLNLSSIDLFN